jgi:hypothetical protein
MWQEGSTRFEKESAHDLEETPTHSKISQWLEASVRADLKNLRDPYCS